MNLFVADPEWGFWIVTYFFLGGIASGAYLIAVLIEWFGSEEDRSLARVAYWIAFPLIVVCALCLTIDLDSPTRFWHMLFKSEVTKGAFAAGFPFSAEGWRLAWHAPIFKYWSPMSVGSWVLTLFGICSFVSFLITLWPERWPARWFRNRWAHGALQAVGCASGFFIAAYTGALLSATNQPMWSDTTWLAPLFLASAASTGLAAMVLLAWWKGVGTPAARERLGGAEPMAQGLELVMLGAFAASLGAGLVPVLLTVRGFILIFGTLLFAILIPLLLHGRVGHLRPWGVPVAAACVLFGGLLLRYGAVTTPGELLARGPATVAAFGPEQDRRHGQPGADPGNHAPDVDVRPRTKLPGMP